MQTCKMTKMVSTSTTCFIVEVKYGSTAKEVKKIITLKMTMKKNMTQQPATALEVLVLSCTSSDAEILRQ